jgi:cellulose 1,4-beta-cellobiosidase
VTGIKRKGPQGRKVIDSSFTKLDSLTKQYNSVSDEFCVVQRRAFGENDSFTKHGGFWQLDASLNKRHVLVLALWDDHDVDMLWLDSVYPTSSNKAGSDRGPCKTSSGVPADVESGAAGSSVEYSDIGFGTIESTSK